ncbi:uncharacterized protein TNCV_1767331 [Trichonephila clavipes]|nr:uncharacterized protein TNCV_1767331 [Trichonephila clavipes]
MNGPNCRIWVTENPHVVHIKACTSKLPYGAGSLLHSLSDAIFFHRETPKGLTTYSVKGERYREILQTCVIPTLQQRGCLHETIFILYGVPPPIVRSIQQMLRHALTDARVIRQSFPTACPP